MLIDLTHGRGDLDPVAYFRESRIPEKALPRKLLVAVRLNEISMT